MSGDTYARKIQLVGGSSYAVSLPKEWIKENNLKEKDTIRIKKTANSSLILDVGKIQEKEIKAIKICVDKLQTKIKPLLLSLYYQGYEEIEIFTKGELTKETRLLVRKIMTHMSGTVIEFESNQKINMKVLLNEVNLTTVQMLYRMSMVIDLLFDNLLETHSDSEVEMNENELDRVYHLFNKTISLLLRQPALLKTSGIEKMSLLPPYILLAKRLESLGDELQALSKILFRDLEKCKNYKKDIKLLQEIFTKILNPIISTKKLNPEETGLESKISNKLKVNNELKWILKILEDIELEAQIIYLSR